MAEKLTVKQQSFINAYLVNGGNASAAARAAGYSKKTAKSVGAENLTKPDIKKALDKERVEVQEAHEITLNEVVGNARELVKRGLKPEPVLNSQGVSTGEYKYDSSAVTKGNDQLIKLGGHYKPQKHEIIDLTEYEARKRLAELRTRKTAVNKSYPT